MAGADRAKKAAESVWLTVVARLSVIALTLFLSISGAIFAMVMPRILDWADGVSDALQEASKALERVTARVDVIDVRNEFHRRQLDGHDQRLDGQDQRLRRLERVAPQEYRGVPRRPDEEEWNGR